MAVPSVTYTFTNGTSANATEVNQNFSDIVGSITDSTGDLAVGSITAGTAVVSSISAEVIDVGSITAGTAAVSSELVVSGTMHVYGNVGMSSMVSIGSAATGNTSMMVYGRTVMYGNVGSYTLECNGDMYTSGAVRGATLDCVGTAVVDSLQVTTAATIGGSLNVTGGGTFEGSVSAPIFTASAVYNTPTVASAPSAVTSLLVEEGGVYKKITPSSLSPVIDANPRTDISSLCVATGWTSTVSPTVFMTSFGRLRLVEFNVVGGSIDTIKGVTLPSEHAAIGNGGPYYQDGVISYEDNGAGISSAHGQVRILSNASHLYFRTTCDGDPWTAANTAAVYGSLIYMANTGL